MFYISFMQSCNLAVLFDVLPLIIILRSLLATISKLLCHLSLVCDLSLLVTQKMMLSLLSLYLFLCHLWLQRSLFCHSYLLTSAVCRSATSWRSTTAAVAILLIISRGAARGTEDSDLADVQIIARILFPNTHVTTTHGATTRHRQKFSDIGEMRGLQKGGNGDELL